MVNYNDGTIHGWNGGNCPVHPNTVVQYWLRNSDCGKEEAGALVWAHHSKTFDIIAFQVIKEYVEPKTIWANEYKNVNLAYHTKEEALKYEYAGIIRKAVKYQEVQE